MIVEFKLDNNGSRTWHRVRNNKIVEDSIDYRSKYI